MIGFIGIAGACLVVLVVLLGGDVLVVASRFEFT